MEQHWSKTIEYPPPLALASILLLLGGWIFYYASLPRNLKDIPYVKASASRMFGDLPAALAHERRTGLLFTYIINKCVELNAPVAQLSFRPFGRPWVVICNGREAQDIMTHRAREFDRSKLSGDLVRAHAPQSQLPMLTNDQWRFNRLLVRNTCRRSF